MRTPSFFYFDMGNVLLTFSHHRGAVQMAKVAGLPVETVERIVYGTTSENGLHWHFERGEFTPEQFYARFCELAECTAPSEDHQKLADACNQIFELNEPLLPLVQAMKTAGRRIGVLSNTSCEHWDSGNARFPQIMGLFPLHALSCNLRLMKPDPAIYARAAELCETPPGEIFFTDDRPDNVAAAKAAGWDAVVFTCAAELREQLVRRNAIPG
jgi:HAD superfamily hydrolase (TIGR01509 family)